MRQGHKAISKISLQAQREIATAEILRDLHEHWTPHPTQQQVLHSIFYDGKKDVFCENGRKWGKSATALYFLIRYALTNPKSANYYIGPEQKQTKEIVWVTQRLQSMVPVKYIKSINNTEMRLTFTNDSFIKLDGSDNTESYRGITPHAIVADEIAQHDRAFWMAMQPNRAVHHGPLLVIGTPPEVENFATELKERVLGNKTRGAYFNFPTSCNPHVSKEWLEEEKAALFARGDEDVWYREYEARFIRSGKNAIFPMFDAAKHVRPKAKLLSAIKCDMHKLWWFCVADPGSTSCFAVLFGALNPFTREFFLLDEIYETDQKYTSSTFIHTKIVQIMSQYPGVVRWSHVYDEAAAWFRGEMVHLYPNHGWCPTNKQAMKRDPLTKEPWGLSVIKDAILQNKLHVADSCRMLIKEISNYHRTFTRAGDVKVLKRDDHLIDCLRYMVWEAGYSLPKQDEPPPKEPWRLPKRFHTLEEDLRNDIWDF